MYARMLIETAGMGLKNLRLHKLRSLLTTLGIICGVGAVICMLSVSEGGAEMEMALIRLLGTHNVIIRSVKPASGGNVASDNSRILEYGLTANDLTVIRATIPHVNRVVALREVAFDVRRGAQSFSATVVGADPQFFQMIHINLARGRFLTEVDDRERLQVCIIGDEVRRRLFAFEDPIGQPVFVSDYERGLIPFEVVGVLSRVQTAGSPARGMGDRDVNADVFIPLATSSALYGDLRIKVGRGSREFTRCAYSDFYVEVDDLEHVVPVSGMLRHCLMHPRSGKMDYVIKVPLENLRLAEAEKRRRQVTLGCIGGISLLVGGIGIMNIMLASVTERTKEIGIRRAIGARRSRIVVQFLINTCVLSLGGGLAGLLVGITIPLLITTFTDMPTVVRPYSLLLAFGISAGIGIVFGLYPAMRAASLDPIEALRRD